MCDTVGMLNIAIHQTQNDCHPIEHDNDLAYLFPVKKIKQLCKNTYSLIYTKWLLVFLDDYISKNQTL